MAGLPPDPRTLNSWEDAFQHPLPVVRKLEQQLRQNIDDNRQKLRSLVGASYRDLLGTAERIIEMDEQMQTVESYMKDIGKKCNAGTVEKIAEGHARMWKSRDVRNGDGNMTLAQTKVLQGTLTAASRILRAGGDALQAAKLFVLSRLLHKSVSESRNPPLLLEQLLRELNKLRSKLLSYVERSLTKLPGDKTQLRNALCAYALITSSSSREVLRHFLQIRYDQLENKTDLPSEKDIVQIFDLYSQTLLDTREIFPRRFAESLSQLAKIPLLQDEQVHSIHELNIDIYRSWIAEDIRTFTPWIRHDQLVASEVTDALVSWTKQAQTSLLDSVRNHLQSENDAHQILQSRHVFVSKFIGLSSKLRNMSSTSAIRDLRIAFLSRLEELAAQSASLEKLTLDEHGVSKLSGDATREGSLWNLAMEDSNLDQGAFQLRQSILNRRHSRTDKMRREIDKLDDWGKRVTDFLDIADTMSSTKWNTDLDFELEDPDDSDSLEAVLSKQDPDQLRKILRGACQDSLLNACTKISNAAASTKYSSFYLRTWREIDLRRRSLGARLSLPTPQISLVEHYRNVARSVAEAATQEYICSTKIDTRATTTLWDGLPPLPVQPLPQTFQFLMRLHQDMSNVGAVLWSPQCVFELKRVLSDTLGQQLNHEGFTNPAQRAELTNGHLEDSSSDIGNDDHIASVEDSKTQSPDRAQLTQNLFDVYYLRRVLNHVGRDDEQQDSLDLLIEAVRKQSHLGNASVERLMKSAGEYWKRTYLLFGLLAPDAVAMK